MIDVACMCCGKVELINGEHSHGRAMELMGFGGRDGEDDQGLWGCTHHALDDLQWQQLGQGLLEVGDWLEACSIA